jgi:hypothetical protein
MTWEHRGELRADPGSAPGERNIEARRKRSSIWPSIAVVAAAAAFGGVIWFAYRNGRDATDTGPPPLVKAEAGPVKVKPDQPGGQEIPFQDSTVYDRLDQGGQKQTVERILPPPETPAVRPAAVQPTVAPADAAAPAANPAPGQAEPSGAPPDALPPNDSSPTALAPPPGALTTPPAPAMAPGAVSRTALAPPPKSPPVAIPSAEEGRATSISALESRALAGFAATPSTVRPAAVEPATARKGGAYRVQLSAVRSEGAVEPEWVRLRRRFPELGGLSLVTSKTEVPGKGTFYRLRAGPLDEADARDTCGHLRAQKLDCIVVKP